MSGALITVVAFALEFSARVMIACVILLRPRRPPAVRLAWLVVLFALPVVGLVAYLLLGGPGFRGGDHGQHGSPELRLELRGLPAGL